MEKKKRSYKLIEDKRRIELRSILVGYYNHLSALDDLFDLLKIDDKKRDENSYKVNMVKTAIEQHRDNIYILERLYSMLGIQEVKLIKDKEPDV